MIINNAYNQYKSMNSTAGVPKTPADKNMAVQGDSEAPVLKPVNLDTVALTTPTAEQYLKAKYPALVYKNVDIDKNYGSWDAFKAKELFSAKPKITKDTLAVYVPPSLQTKMDADPVYAMEMARKTETFLEAKTSGDSYTIGKNVSVIVSLDENGEIGDRWTTTIWPQLSAAEIDSYPQRAAAEEVATAHAQKNEVQNASAVERVAEQTDTTAQPETTQDSTEDIIKSV